MLLGLKCRETKQVKLFYVENRKKQTLLPLILQNIAPGSVIISDKFASYVNIRRDESHLDEHGYYHFWVNHSIEFVDKHQPFIHTNGIERSWRSIRNQISSIKRTFRPKLVQEYLDTFMVKSMKTTQEFYEFMLEAIIHLNNNMEYHEEIAEN